MSKPLTLKVLAIALSFTCITGFGLKDLTTPIGDKLGGGDKCEDDDKSCKLKAEVKGVALTAAAAAAVKLLKDMVVEHNVQKVTGETEVIDKYKKDHNKLPKKPVAMTYTSMSDPGNVIKPGDTVKLISEIEVVPSKKKQKIVIEERITIFDRDDPKQVLRSFVKPVNQDNKRGGAYQNTIQFTIPKGMQQGKYPITTDLLLDKKVAKNVKTDLKLVLNVLPSGEGQIIALN